MPTAARPGRGAADANDVVAGLMLAVPVAMPILGVLHISHRVSRAALSYVHAAHDQSGGVAERALTLEEGPP